MLRKRVAPHSEVIRVIVLEDSPCVMRSRTGVLEAASRDVELKGRDRVRVLVRHQQPLAGRVELEVPRRLTCAGSNSNHKAKGAVSAKKGGENTSERQCCGVPSPRVWYIPASESSPCVVRDANMGHRLAGGNSSECPELEYRTTPVAWSSREPGGSRSSCARGWRSRRIDLRHSKERRHCFSHDGSEDIRQRQCVNREGSGSTRQRQCLSHNGSGSTRRR